MRPLRPLRLPRARLGHRVIERAEWAQEGQGPSPLSFRESTVLRTGVIAGLNEEPSGRICKVDAGCARQWVLVSLPIMPGR